MVSRLVGTSATDAKTRMKCFGGRVTGADVGLGPTQTDYRECIGKDIGF